MDNPDNGGRKIKLCFIVPAHWDALMGGSQYQAKLLIEHLLTLGKYDIYYLLGLLNSKLLTFHARSICPPKLNDYRRFNCNSLNALPIRKIFFSNAAEKRTHDKIVSLVERMLDMHKQLPETRTPHEKEALQRRIDATDAQIDKLVYDLYGLTSEEIAMIESSV